MQKIQGVVQQGNTKVLTSGLNSTTLVQGSFPSATVTVFAEPPVAVNISSISRSSNVVTANIGSGAGFIAGQSVTIAGVTDSSYNGVFTITSYIGSNLVYSQTGANSSSSGGTAASVQLASIFSDNVGTVLSNPFTADSKGNWGFWAKPGLYDVELSSGGLSTPFTLTSLGANIATYLGTAYISPLDQGGVDFGAQINNAVALLSAGGIIDARGATGTLVASATINLNKALTLLLPVGAITLQGSPGINVSASGVAIIGQGQGSTTLSFAPSGAASAILWQAPGGVAIVGGFIRGITFDAASDTTHTKKGIQIIDADQLELSDIQFSNWHDGSNLSEGIEIQGRQTITCSRITCVADKPFRIMVDPNTAVVAADHFHFHDIYTIASSTNPNFTIDSGVWLTNCTWDGYQAWVLGGYGLYWNDTTGTNNSRNIHIENVRWEQSTNATGYAIYMSPNHQTFNITVINNYTDFNTGHRGYYFRNIKAGLFAGNVYEGSGEAFNADSSSSFLVASNFFNVNAGATFVTTGFAGIWYGNDASGAGIATARLGLGWPNPANQVVIPNNTAYSVLNNAGNAEIKALTVDSTNSHVALAPSGTPAYIGGTLSLAGDRATGGYPAVIANGGSGSPAPAYAAENAAGSDAFPLISLDGNNNVLVAPQKNSNRAYTTSPSWSFAGDTGVGRTIYTGAGNPNGSQVGNPGDLYLNASGGSGTTLYVKETGTGTNTGWVGK
jgi:hypothetical protein